ncbi:MAG TPA: XdhC family protein [Solirubrobacteraceae bacterium]|nr:XdhC family protein [Solirubrobacteraceae bacterium]
MREVLEEIEAWSDRGESVAVATVVAVRRSAPRPPGAKMVVAGSGEIAGMVSGGCVEGAVVEVCEEVLAGGPPRLLHFGIADEEAWDVGLPCGGEIDVWVQRFEQRRFAELARAGGRGALVTALDGPSAGAAVLVDADGAVSGSLGAEELDRAAVEIADELMWAERSERRTAGEVTLFADAVFPPPRIVIFGAVDIAAQLCRLARVAGWRPYVIDPRARFATPERFPEAEEVLALWPEEALARLGGIDRATFVAVLTHDPKLDDAALSLALRSEAAYIGAMGSRRAQEQRRERLRAVGIGDEELERLSAPIGLDLGALTPEETALSIMAELVATRNGREGGRLAHSRGRIHEVGA